MNEKENYIYNDNSCIFKALLIPHEGLRKKKPKNID